MAQARDFTRGSVLPKIVSLALPIMGTAFIQMAYSLADYFWIGHEGSGAMTAVGAAGIYLWFANALTTITKTGAEVTIAQALGVKDMHLGYRYARHALILSLVFGLVVGALLLALHRPLIGFYSIRALETVGQGERYLRIVALGVPFTFLNATYFGLYNGFGYSRTPFIANSIGLLLNVILDPILIRGYLGIPRLGVAGAAYATVLAQGVVLLIVVVANMRPVARFHHLLRGFRPDVGFMRRLLVLGMPVGVQNALFSVIGMVIARLVTRWGDMGVGVQSIGAQIEAITWMTAGGFSSALASYTGQNFSACRFKRIHQGYVRTLLLMGGVSVLASVLFIAWGKQLFSVFMPEPQAAAEGGRYLRIMGFSQLFMVLEILAVGVLNGMGRTLPPAVVGVTFNVLRIPLSLWWGSYALQGIWWAITVSSICKGSLLTLLLFRAVRRVPRALRRASRGVGGYKKSG